MAQQHTMRPSYMLRCPRLPNPLYRRVWFSSTGPCIVADFVRTHRSQRV